MIDTHAHLNFSEFDKDLDEVISGCWEKGLQNIIVVSSGLESSKKSIQISKKDRRLRASVGIHPEDVSEAGLFSKIKTLAQDQAVVAVGETGLDYYRLEKESDKEKQRELMENHIVLAKNLEKPLIFHCREAHEDFLGCAAKVEGRAVLHCFTGDWDFAAKILGLGFLISFTGIITFTRDKNLIEVVKRIPLEKIMVETDCPFLAPLPFRGKRCEPWMVRAVVEKIAEIKDISEAQVREATTTNAKIFFGL